MFFILFQFSSGPARFESLLFIQPQPVVFLTRVVTSLSAEVHDTDADADVLAVTDLDTLQAIVHRESSSPASLPTTSSSSKDDTKHQLLSFFSESPLKKHSDRHRWTVCY